MSIQRHRMNKGWSQEQLAEVSGLSVRTIQRVESGQAPSLETLRCFASVFETPISQLLEESAISETSTGAPSLQSREEHAVEYVKQLKGFYVHSLIFVIAIICLSVLNWVISPQVWWVIYVIVPWALALGLQALITFSVFNVLGPDWERRQFLKQMQREPR